MNSGKKMGAAAVKAASAINYESVGTIEFLVDKHRNFIHGNEHPYTGGALCDRRSNKLDLIKEQIKIAAAIRYQV